MPETSLPCRPKNPPTPSKKHPKRPQDLPGQFRRPQDSPRTSPRQPQNAPKTTLDPRNATRRLARARYLPILPPRRPQMIVFASIFSRCSRICLSTWGRFCHSTPFVFWKRYHAKMAEARNQTGIINTICNIVYNTIYSTVYCTVYSTVQKSQHWIQDCFRLLVPHTALYTELYTAFYIWIQYSDRWPSSMWV